MADLAMERAPLALAERDIIKGKDRVFQEEELVALMHSRDQNTTGAEVLLRALRATLRIWKAHRDQTLRAIANPEN